MAYRVLVSRLVSGRVLAGGVALGGAVWGAKTLIGDGKKQKLYANEAKIQFDTPFGYVYNNKQIVNVPADWTGRLFELSNEYKPLFASQKEATTTNNKSTELPPMPGPTDPFPILPGTEAPWLNVDFIKHPEDYCKVVKEFCWEGFVHNAQNPDYEDRATNQNYNPFLPKYNSIRKWYHAPWMHASLNGRECLNGLTFERPTPAFELASTQNRQLQTWACGFYNAIGSTVFGEIWKNPDQPEWFDVKFPEGTLVFKILMTDATDQEVFTMQGAPGFQAVIAKPATPGAPVKNGEVRNDHSTTLRLLQVDFATRDDRAPTGWVFGTFMYDGSQPDKEPWDRVIPVGAMWGNDPELWPKDALAGEKPVESWINPKAEALRIKLKGNKGTRPSWGWWGRMNGPADYFRSACSSCHSTSSWSTDMTEQPPKMIWDADCLKITDPKLRKACREKIKPATRMHWFRNLKSPETFSGAANDKTGDYSLQLQMGFANYKAWLNSQKEIHDADYRTKLAIPDSVESREAAYIEAKRQPLRAVGLQQEERED